VLLLLLGTAVALYRRWWTGFWGAWFFLVLAPTSSVLPIADVAFEHRMYLPLAAVVAVAVIGGCDVLRALSRRLAVPTRMVGWLGLGLVAAVSLGLGMATVRRNDDYRSELGMWSDVVARRPDNPRAHYTLGNVLDREGRLAEAMRQYDEALRLKPDYVDAHVNLGAALLASGRQADAMGHFSEAIRLKPGSAQAHNNLGAVLFSQGRLPEAIEHLSAAARLDPASSETERNLATALLYHGQVDEAIAHYNRALAINPGDADARKELAAAMARRTKSGPGS